DTSRDDHVSDWVYFEPQLTIVGLDQHVRRTDGRGIWLAILVLCGADRRAAVFSGSSDRWQPWKDGGLACGCVLCQRADVGYLERPRGKSSQYGNAWTLLLPDRRSRELLRNRWVLQYDLSCDSPPGHSSGRPLCLGQTSSGAHDHGRSVQ